MVYDHESMRSGLQPVIRVRPYTCSHGYFRIRTLGQSATEGIMVLVPCDLRPWDSIGRSFRGCAVCRTACSLPQAPERSDGR